jgi:hypothetical protein
MHLLERLTDSRYFLGTHPHKTWFCVPWSYQDAKVPLKEHVEWQKILSKGEKLTRK